METLDSTAWARRHQNQKVSLFNPPFTSTQNILVEEGTHAMLNSAIASFKAPLTVKETRSLKWVSATGLSWCLHVHVHLLMNMNMMMQTHG
jgi:hypothetical protein